MMANAAKGEVAFGTGRTLALTYNVLCAVEDDLGKGLLEIMPGGLDLRQTRTIVWHALKEKEPELTLVEAGNIIFSLGFAVAGAALVKAIQVALGVEETGADDDDDDAEGNAQTGTPQP